MRVPEQGTLGFVILSGAPGELMLHTRPILADDLPDVAKRNPTHILYVDVASIDDAKKALRGATITLRCHRSVAGADGPRHPGPVAQH